MRPLQPCLLVALLALAMFPAPATAHGILARLPVEHELLQDEGEDAFLVIDGYDLYDLYARETHWPDVGDGLTFRFQLYGGFGVPTSTANALHIEIGVETPAGPRSVVLTTTDDQEWTSDGATIVALEVEPDVSGYYTTMQVLVTYDDLGVAPGATVSGAWMKSYVDDRVVDVAPGGLMVDDVEVPAESVRVTDAFELKGPVGYVNVTAMQANGTAARLAVANAFSDAGQHVHLMVGDAPGWAYEITSFAEVPLDGGQNTTFVVAYTKAGGAPLPLHVMTDLGGLVTYYVQRTGEGWTISDAPGDMAPDQTPVAEAPAPALFLLVALAGLAVTLRRRRDPPAS